MRISYEALAWGTKINTYDRSWDIVRAADHPTLGECLDSFHILYRGSDPSGIEQIPGENYAGPLSLEVFNDVFRQSDPARAAVDAHRSLLALYESTVGSVPLDRASSVVAGSDHGESAVRIRGDRLHPHDVADHLRPPRQGHRRPDDGSSLADVRSRAHPRLEVLADLRLVQFEQAADRQ